MTTRGPSTVKSTSFSPDALLSAWEAGTLQAPHDADLSTALSRAFNIRPTDGYVYHAVAAVTLPQAQDAVNAGAAHGLHAWYVSPSGAQLDPPSRADVDAYTAIFASTTSTSKALTAFSANAKKDSIRARVAANLAAKRTFPASLTIPKRKTPHTNPYLDFWAWSCTNLEWAGPDAETTNTRQSHHILPLFYHHFGCVCPSFEALEAIRRLANGRAVVDAGSGNGYWTYLLRRLGLHVTAVDNGDSVWRTTWIGDTVRADAAAYLRQNGGGKDAVLLLVYPQVTTAFTAATLAAYSGDVICVAGTQNANGFTAFQDVTIDEYLQKEKPGFRKVVQTPLPSFAGKDEALYVFTR